jgi:hypothetical protein
MENILGEIRQRLGLRAVPLRGDREVPPRHVLLQRLPRAALRAEESRENPQSPNGRDLRPQARDVRRWRLLTPSSAASNPRLRAFHGRQLCQRRHGRPHRLASPPPRAPCEVVDACVGQIVTAVLARGGSADRHRRPRQRGADVRPRHRQAPHRPHDLRRARSSLSDRPSRDDASAPPGGSPISPPPCSPCSACPSLPR